MNTSGIQPLQFNPLTAYQRLSKPTGQLPPPSSSVQAEGDTLQISAEAMQKRFANVPASVTAAVSDLQGDQANMAADFRTIGDYFQDNGGRPALDAYLRSNFTEAQLRAFPPPAEGARIDPPRGMPSAVVSAVSDLKGDQTNMTDDFKTIRNYFEDKGGREAFHAFMKSTFCSGKS